MTVLLFFRAVSFYLFNKKDLTLRHAKGQKTTCTKHSWSRILTTSANPPIFLLSYPLPNLYTTTAKWRS